MINRTKLSVIAVSAVLAVALTGCGGSHERFVINNAKFAAKAEAKKG